MRKRMAIHAVLLCGLAAAGARGGGLLDNLPFLDAGTGMHQRRGTADFGGGRTENIDKHQLVTFGVGLGRRWSLSDAWRAQLCANVNYGSVAEDTLDNGADNPPGVVAMTLLYGGVLTDIHYSLSPGSNAAVFLHTGTGVHITSMHETETVLGDQSQRILDSYLQDQTCLSASVHGGIGFEKTVSSTLGFALVYSLRWWFPVRYGMVRDLFPIEPVPYRERFLSHELDLQILVKRY